MSEYGLNAGGASGLRRVLPLLLAGLAMMLGFFAATTQAHASEVWTNEEGPLEENAEVGLNGYFAWNLGGATVHCDIEAKATLMPGSEGEMTDFDFIDCYGTGAYQTCTITTSNVSTPWSLYADSGVISADDVSWQWTREGQCLKVPMKLTADFDFTPDNKLAISYVNLASGPVWYEGGGGQGPVGQVTGQLEFDPVGVYGLQ